MGGYRTSKGSKSVSCPAHDDAKSAAKAGGPGFATRPEFQRQMTWGNGRIDQHIADLQSKDGEPALAVQEKPPRRRSAPPADSPALAVQEMPWWARELDEDGSDSSSAGDGIDRSTSFGAQSEEEEISTVYPEIDEACVSESLFGMVPHQNPNAGGAQTNFTITDCGDEVTIDLPFRTDASQAGVVGRYKEGILGVLDDQYQLTDPDGSTHGVRVNPTFQDRAEGGDNAYFNDIYDAEKRRGRNAGVVDMLHFPTIEPDRPEGAGDAWERTSPNSIENSAAHEAAHRLMMPDRYWRSASDFDLIVGRPPEPWELQTESTANRAATYKQSNNLMGDAVPILPENGLDGLLPYIEGVRGIPAISTLQYPPEYPVCEPGWPK